MIRPLLVAVAHGIDLLSFLMAVAALGIQGESNSLMRSLYDQFGLLGIVALKASGTTALACITVMRPWALLPSAGSGIIGATTNVVALLI